jgi:CheY-like chemotaxis protein
MTASPAKATTPRKPLTAIVDMILPMTTHNELSSHLRGTTTHQAHILVIDDNSRHYGQIVSSLISEGYTAQVVEDGEQALTLLRQQRFDMVLLAVTTPTLDGCHVLKLLKSVPQFSQLPVVMMSAQDDIETTIKCIALGAEDYLIEPLQGTLLKARINASLERQVVRERDRQRLEDANMLRNISQTMHASLEPTRVLKIAFAHALQRLQPTAGLIGTLENGTLTVVDSFGFGERFTNMKLLPLSEMGWQGIVQAERPYISQYQAVMKDASGLSPYESCFIVPIRRERTVATMLLYHPQDSTADTITFIEQLAEDAGLALRNATMYREAIGWSEQQQTQLNMTSREIKLVSTTIKECSSLIRFGKRDNQMEMLDAIRNNASQLFMLSTELETKLKKRSTDASQPMNDTGDDSTAQS